MTLGQQIIAYCADNPGWHTIAQMKAGGVPIINGGGSTLNVLVGKGALEVRRAENQASVHARHAAKLEYRAAQCEHTSEIFERLIGRPPQVPPHGTTHDLTDTHRPQPAQTCAPALSRNGYALDI